MRSDRSDYGSALIGLALLIALGWLLYHLFPAGADREPSQRPLTPAERQLIEEDDELIRGPDGGVEP